MLTTNTLTLISINSPLKLLRIPSQTLPSVRETKHFYLGSKTPKPKFQHAHRDKPCRPCRGGTLSDLVITLKPTCSLRQALEALSQWAALCLRLLGEIITPTATRPRRLVAARGYCSPWNIRESPFSPPITPESDPNLLGIIPRH